jgi:hypothetical protein
MANSFDLAEYEIKKKCAELKIEARSFSINNNMLIVGVYIVGGCKLELYIPFNSNDHMEMVKYFVRELDLHLCEIHKQVSRIAEAIEMEVWGR